MTAGRYAQSQATFTDCTTHGAGCELFLVEGESAARSVVVVRDAAMQAVLPLQGKPMNAWKADATKVRSNVLFRQLAGVLGWSDAITPMAASPRFERVLLLFDPDADGIHIGALMLLYFARWQPAFLGAGHVWMVRAPMATLTHAGTGESMQAYSPAHADALMAHLRASGEGAIHNHRHLGLGSIPPEVLRRTCVDPTTRQCKRVDATDIDAIKQAFALT